ncbi:hypothetical protein PT974_01414 [Cladobotryum mycophilum]|uniref:Uncharacterized protein n=1 Tax=Cladobotryum mycophilum TaxID=491253 RepID=A0ABR0T3N6_9HYPO
MPSLLEALTKPNVAVTNYAVKGSNTDSGGDVHVENWTPWIDFNYTTLTRIFRQELSQGYHGSADQAPLEQDLCICNEATFDDLVRRFICPIVNYALAGQPGSCHYGRGTRCPSKHEPDWLVISSNWIGDKGYINVLPGDTKLDSKWWPSMIHDPDNFEEWQKVMHQAVSYMIKEENRYGFIITDANMVVLRLTRRPVENGIAAGRPRRGNLASHQRQISDASMVDPESSFVDDNTMNWDYYPPEFAVIPWDTYGSGKLTIKLALWCLAMIAANGDRYIACSYPNLDSWRRGNDGYVHNTSGATSSTLSDGLCHEEPDLEGRIVNVGGDQDSSHAGSADGDSEFEQSSDGQDEDDEDDEKTIIPTRPKHAAEN